MCCCGFWLAIQLIKNICKLSCILLLILVLSSAHLITGLLIYTVSVWPSGKQLIIDNIHDFQVLLQKPQQHLGYCDTATDWHFFQISSLLSLEILSFQMKLVSLVVYTVANLHTWKIAYIFEIVGRNHLKIPQYNTSYLVYLHVNIWVIW